MANIAERSTGESSIPAHTPIVVCPSCGIHTAHVMPLMGAYRCLVCETTHDLARVAKVAIELEPLWCPVCRSQTGVTGWAPVNGQRTCRTCGTTVMVATEESR